MVRNHRLDDTDTLRPPDEQTVHKTCSWYQEGCVSERKLGYRLLRFLRLLDSIYNIKRGVRLKLNGASPAMM